MRPNQPEIVLSFLAATAVAFAGAVSSGCAPAEPTAEPVGGGAAGSMAAEPGPLITAKRSFHGDPLYEWVSGGADATFHRYEPASFELSSLGDAGEARTVTARIDGEVVLKRRIPAHDGQAVHVPVDTTEHATGAHTMAVEVEQSSGPIHRAQLEFQIIFNVTAVATDPLFGGVVAGTAEAGAYWFPDGADEPPRHLPADLLHQGWDENARFGRYPSAARADATSGLSILRARYDANLGGFWLGSLFQGFTLFLPGADADDDRFVHVHVPNDDLAPLSPEQLEPRVDEDWAALHALASRDSVVDMLPDEDGLWIATFNGLVRWEHGGTPADPSDDAWRVAVPPDPHLASIARDDEGLIWVGSWDFSPEGEPALFVFDPAADTFSPVEIEADRVLSLAVDRAGLVWVGTDAGLYRIAPEAGGAHDIRRYGAADGLRDQDVLAILPERQGPGVWFGTVDVCGGDGGGLHRLRPDPAGDELVVLTRADGLGDDDITSLAYGSDGQLWAGTFNLLAASNITKMWELSIPECDGGDDPVQTRNGSDGLSRITQAAPGRFEIDNL